MLTLYQIERETETKTETERDKWKRKRGGRWRKKSKASESESRALEIVSHTFRSKPKTMKAVVAPYTCTFSILIFFVGFSGLYFLTNNYYTVPSSLNEAIESWELARVY